MKEETAEGAKIAEKIFFSACSAISAVKPSCVVP
jgi:hypothetical protein